MGRRTGQGGNKTKPSAREAKRAAARRKKPRRLPTQRCTRKQQQRYATYVVIPLAALLLYYCAPLIVMPAGMMGGGSSDEDLSTAADVQDWNSAPIESDSVVGDSEDSPAATAAEVDALATTLTGGQSSDDAFSISAEAARSIAAQGEKAKKMGAAEASLYHREGDPPLPTFTKRALKAAKARRAAEIRQENHEIEFAISQVAEVNLRRVTRLPDGGIQFNRMYPDLPGDLNRAEIFQKYGQRMARPSKSSRVLKGVLPDIIPLMNKYEVMLHRRMKKLHTSAHLSDVGPESEMHHLHVEAMEYRMGVRIKATNKWWSLAKLHMDSFGWVNIHALLDAREALTLRWACRYALEFFDPTHEPGNPTELFVRAALRNTMFNNHAAHVRDRKNRLCKNPDGSDIIHPEDAPTFGAMATLSGDDDDLDEDEDEDDDVVHRGRSPSELLKLLPANHRLNTKKLKPLFDEETIRKQLEGSGIDEPLPLYSLDTLLAGGLDEASIRGLTHIGSDGANLYGGAAIWSQSDADSTVCVSRQPFDRTYNPHRALTRESHPLAGVQKQLRNAETMGTPMISDEMLHFGYTNEMQAIVRSVALGERLAELAAALMGVPKSVGVRLYQSTLFYKRKGDWYSPWHWDNIASPFDKPLMTVWIALNRVDTGMGALSFASGSHKRKGQHLSSGRRMKRSWSHDEVNKQFKIEPSNHRLWPGDATFHHGSTLHAAWRNSGSSTREAIAIVYVPANARLRPGRELNESIRQDDVPTWAEWLPRSKFIKHGGRKLKGWKAAERFWPVIWGEGGEGLTPDEERKLKARRKKLKRKKRDAEKKRRKLAKKNGGGTNNRKEKTTTTTTKKKKKQKKKKETEERFPVPNIEF